MVIVINVAFIFLQYCFLLFLKFHYAPSYYVTDTNRIILKIDTSIFYENLLINIFTLMFLYFPKYFINIETLALLYHLKYYAMCIFLTSYIKL